MNDTEPIIPFESWVKRLSLFTFCALLILCTFGILGNLLSVIVFAQSHFRRLSINLLLAALSVADMLLLILAVPVFGTGPLLTAYPESWRIVGPVFTYSAGYLYPLVAMLQCCSVWLLMAITLERWAAVCRPFLVGTYFTRKRALLIIAIISITSFGYNFVRFWEFSVPGPYQLELLLRKSASYMLWKVTVAKLATTYLIPLSVLIIFNSLVAREVIRSQKARFEMSLMERSNRRTAKMLLFVVLSFICCYSLSLVLNLWEVMKPGWFRTDIGRAVSDLNNILVVLNSASTWLLYICFSTRYRQTVVSLAIRVFCCKSAESYQQGVYTTTFLSPASSNHWKSLKDRRMSHVEFERNRRTSRNDSLVMNTLDKYHTNRLYSCKLNLQPSSGHCIRKRSASLNMESERRKALVKHANSTWFEDC